MPVPDSFQLLLSKNHIEDVLKRYTRAIDRLDDEAISSCFHADSTLRMGDHEMTGQEFCSLVMGMLRGLEIAHHQIGNIQIEIEDNVAYADTYFTSIHQVGADGWSPFPQARPGEDLMMRGRYIDRLECRNGIWAIAHRDVSIDWARFDVGGERGGSPHPAELRTRGSRTDPVYRRWSVQ